MTLSPDQLQAIDRHLRRENWLLNENLIDELTDHYAAGITEKMAKGQPFDDSLIEVSRGFGFRAGLLKLEAEFVQVANKTAWAEYKRVLWLYARVPGLLCLPIVAFVVWHLLFQYWHVTSIILLILNCSMFVLVNWPWWRWNLEENKFDWENRPLRGYYQRKLAGAEKVTSLVSGAALSLFVLVYLLYFPITWTHLYNADSPALAAFWFTLSFIGYASVAKFTYRRNPLLKWLT